jgi:hypothetical protein
MSPFGWWRSSNDPRVAHRKYPPGGGVSVVVGGCRWWWRGGFRLRADTVDVGDEGEGQGGAGARRRPVAQTKDVRRATSSLDALRPPVPVNAAGGAYGNWACPGSSGDRALRGRSADVPLMGLPLVPMTVSWPADTKLFVRGTSATRKGHSAQNDALLKFVRRLPSGPRHCEVLSWTALSCRGATSNRQAHR